MTVLRRFVVMEIINRCVLLLMHRWWPSKAISGDFDQTWALSAFVRQGLSKRNLLLPICAASKISNVTGRQRGPKRRLRAGYRAPSLKWTSHVAMRFYRRVWLVSRGFSVLCVYSKFGIILISRATFVPIFVSFAASVAELAYGETSRQSITHPAYLMPRERIMQ